MQRLILNAMKEHLWREVVVPVAIAALAAYATIKAASIEFHPGGKSKDKDEDQNEKADSGGFVGNCCCCRHLHKLCCDKPANPVVTEDQNCGPPD